MKNYYEFKDEKSAKFWEIEHKEQSNKISVRFGKIGAEGTIQFKEFDSVEEAEIEVDKLIKSKVKKGYQEIENSDNSNNTDETASGKLRTMLKPLCSTDEDNEILENLCNNVVDFSDDKISFEETELNYEKNISIVPDKSLPKSFREIAAIATSLTWDGGGPEVGYMLCNDGTTAGDDWLLEEIEIEEKEIELITPAFIAGQNGLFFDNNRKLENGEPAFGFVSHEDCEYVEVTSVDDLNYKQIFLRMLSDAMIETDYIDEIYF
jgi:predicted DNA-binding WGR domain protein